MQAFEDYVVARTPALLLYGYALTGDAARAEDLVQGALAATYRHWGRVGTGGAEAYVRRAVLNAHLNRWRRLSRREQLTDTPPEVHTPDATSSVDERDAVWGALATLPPRQRAVIVLRYYEDLSEAQIAEALGCSAGTVKSQSSKALAKLRLVTGLREEALG